MVTPYTLLTYFALSVFPDPGRPLRMISFLQRLFPILMSVYLAKPKHAVNVSSSSSVDNAYPTKFNKAT